MTGLVYGSVCSGIEAASVAWAPLGWQAAFVSEIDAAPRAVLTHRYPQVSLHGDFTTIRAGEYPAIDLLVGGTPCQSFSVAGLRGGLADDRGNLALQYLRLANRLRPRWLVWENVPGVLSSNGGRDFGAILGGMVELGYGFAYRVLDAQYVRVDGYGRAVPQRRRRVFVVGYLGDWRRPAAVLLERACLRGDPAPRRETGAGVAGSAGGGAGSSCGGAGRPPTWRAAAQAFGGGANCNPTDVGTAVSAHAGGRYDLDTETFVAAPTPLLASGAGNANSLGVGRPGDPSFALDTTGAMAIAFDTTQITSAANRSSPQSGDPCHPLAAGAHAPAIAFSCKDHGADATDEGVTPTLRAMGFDRSHANAGGQLAVAYGISCDAFDRSGEGAAGTAAERSGLGIVEGISPTIKAKRPNGVAHGWSVRRLTPTECERLQGFPDGWTAVPWRGGTMPDGPRYKMLGNSMAVNIMRWIGRRIEAVEALPHPKAGGLQDETDPSGRVPADPGPRADVPSRCASRPPQSDDGSGR